MGTYMATIPNPVTPELVDAAGHWLDRWAASYGIWLFALLVLLIVAWGWGRRRRRGG